MTTEQEFQAFQKLLDSHDKYYMMSDDRRSYDSGMRQAAEIKFFTERLSCIDKTRVDSMIDKSGIYK